MSIKNIGLNKLLKILYLPENKIVSELRSDLRQEVSKATGIANDGGGDFYGPFWSDAKKYVAGELDLNQQTNLRIESHAGRMNLYPMLKTGFLTWWLEKRRWSNLSFAPVSKSIKGHATFDEMGALVRVGNLLSLKIGDDTHRLIYPYFAKEPAMVDEAARLGLWIMNEALPDYPIEDMRILDVLRAKSFAIRDYPLRGNEATLFEQKYSRIIHRWENLKSDYSHFAA